MPWVFGRRAGYVIMYGCVRGGWGGYMQTHRVLCAGVELMCTSRRKQVGEGVLPGYCIHHDDDEDFLIHLIITLCAAYAASDEYIGFMLCL